LRPDAKDSAAVPDRLAGYEIVGLLGEGGSGTVYAARGDGHEVALKVLRTDQAPTGKERRRWMDEARHMARIEHKGVVRVYGAGELPDGRPFLAMERLAGTNLATRLASGPLPLATALCLFDQLASAAQAIHDAGLIHRDLKPENIMLQEGEQRVVILDFGIAREAEGPPSTTTQAGYRRGTPAVMAPERFFGERATIRTDIYELAVVLYVMITGGLPWREILDARSRLNPTPPNAAGADVPPSVEAALMRALSSDPDDRPSSVAELAASIRQAGWEGDTQPAHTPLPRPDAPPPQTSTARVGANWWLRGALLLGLGVFAGGIGLALRSDPARVASSNPAPARAADAGAAAPVVSPLVAIDAGIAAAASPVAAPVVTPRPKKSRPRKRPAPHKTAAPVAKAPPPGGPMPWCRKQVALYCTAEFERSEGALAGTLCKKMDEQVASWEKLPPAAVSSLEDNCKKNYPTYAKAAAERIRFYHQQVESAPGPR